MACSRWWAEPCSRRWAFPAALWFLGAFVAYEGYRIARTRSPALVVRMAVDVGVLLLIWREYRWRRRVGGAVQG